MFTKRKRSDDEEEPRITTRARSKAKQLNSTIENSIDSGTNVPSSNRRKGKKQLMFTDNVTNDSILHNLSPQNKVSVSGNNSIRRNSKRLKKDDLNETSNLTHNIRKTPEKPTIILPAVPADKTDSSSLRINNYVTADHTPRRSTKTPKKSPKNLSSPKGRLSKMPRKLLTTDSPSVSKKSKSPEEKNDVNKGTPNTPLLTKGDSKISSSLSKKLGTRKFSKSPKIVLLRTPKLKVKKLNSPKLKAKKISPLKLEAKKSSSPELKSGITKHLTPSKVKKTPERKKSLETPVAGKSTPNGRISTNNSKKLSPKEMALMFKHPVVVLQRLPILNDKPEVNLKPPVLPKKRSKPAKFVNTSTISSQGKNILGIENMDELGAPLNFSTPLEKLKKLNMSRAEPSPKRRSLTREKNNSPVYGKIRPNKSADTSDQAEPNEIESKLKENSTFDVSGTPNTSASKRNTLSIENVEPEKEKDGTYELDEPKTPKLRAQIQKTRFSLKISPEKESIKNLKVHFASPIANRGSLAKNMQFTPARKTTSAGKSASIDINRSKKSSFSHSRRRSNSLTDTTSLQIRRKPKVVGDVATTPSTPLTFSGKKSHPKYSATKKIPNFTEIHKKIFDKSESLIDAKKRIQERHISLATTKNVTTKIKTTPREKKLQPDRSGNGVYNRFGFKLRKTEAMDCIMNRGNTYSRKKQQEENRSILKGVRTNRRFELQMKSRNINI